MQDIKYIKNLIFLKRITISLFRSYQLSQVPPESGDAGGRRREHGRTCQPTRTEEILRPPYQCLKNGPKPTWAGWVGGGGCWWDGDEAVFFLAVVCCLSFIICCNFLLLFYIFLMSLNNSYRINLVGKVKLFSCVYIFLH